MTDISQSSQVSITQALTQLSRLDPKYEVVRQGVDVLVKHLAGNVLSLNKSDVLLNKEVLLAGVEIKGTLAEGQTHQVKLSLEGSPSLLFFSQKSAKSTSIISLTEPQLQSLLQLSAKQLVSSHLLTKSDTANQLSVVNATVLSVLSKEQLAAQVDPKLSETPLTINLKDTKNTRVINQQNMLKVSLTDQHPPVEIALPVKQLKPFTAGEKVTISIAPRGNNWQITVIQNKTNTSQLNKIADQLLPHTAHINNTPPTTRASSNSDVSVAAEKQSILSPLLASPIIKASLLRSNLTKPFNVDLPINPVLQQLKKINPEQNHGLIQKLQALPIDKISLQIKPIGDSVLLIQHSKPVANIPITKEIALALIPLKLPDQQAVFKQLSYPTDSHKHLQPPHQVLHPKANANVQIASVSFVDGNATPETGLSIKQASANLLAAIKKDPFVQGVVNPSLLANKAQQINLVQSLLRVVQAKAETPAITLQSLEKALADNDFLKGATEQPSKQVVEQLLQQIKQALPQGKEQDVNQIKQLLTAPALNLSSLQMISPTSNQGFMSGLVTLLQMSLTARLTRNQTGRAEYITSTLNNVLGTTKKSETNMTQKALGELSQLEQKHQLVKEIGRIFSGHQANKLINAEQMIQGQDTFYYNLPSVLGGTFKDMELLIKREDNKEASSSAETKNKTWQLTMKLDVGELGGLLTKAKLRSDTLEINFYASNEAVKIQVMNYLPLLRRKLDSIGIEVSKSHCQLGKIPDTLQQRPYHTFQTKA